MKLQLSFETQQWASAYLLLNSFQEISLKNLLKDCRLLLIKWVFSRYPRGEKKSHNGETHTSRIQYSQCTWRHSLNTRKVCHWIETFLASTYNEKENLWSFCLLGDLGFSRWRAPVKFNFLPGPLALSMVGLTWCDRSDSGHVTGGFGSKKACCHRENSQPGRSPAQSPLMVRRHMLLSSAQSISAGSVEERLILLSPTVLSVFWDFFYVYMAS